MRQSHCWRMTTSGEPHGVVEEIGTSSAGTPIEWDPGEDHGRV